MVFLPYGFDAPYSTEKNSPATIVITMTYLLTYHDFGTAYKYPDLLTYLLSGRSEMTALLVYLSHNILQHFLDSESHECTRVERLLQLTLERKDVDSALDHTPNDVQNKVVMWPGILHCT